MKKIAIAGPHGQGKTTLCFNISNNLKKDGYNVEILQEQARFSPFGINDNMTIETSYWVLTNQIKTELEAQNRKLDYLICDRTPLDTYLYARHFGLDRGDLTRNFKELAESWLQTYHAVYILENKNQDVKNDNVRSTDQEFLKEIKKLFSYTFCFPRGDNVEVVRFSNYKMLDNYKYFL